MYKFFTINTVLTLLGKNVYNNQDISTDTFHLISFNAHAGNELVLVVLQLNMLLQLNHAHL